MSQIIEAKLGQNLQELMDRTDPGSVIRLPAGEWRQKFTIRTPGLTLLGAGAEQCRIVYDDYALKKDEQGREYNTFRTWTAAVTADGVRMRDLAIVNDSGHPEVKGQEVALSVYGDDFSMERCLLSSTQDTLFVGPLPQDLIARYEGFLPDELRQDRLLTQRFRDCRIEGTVDFIFGCGDALFDRCEIRSVFDEREIGYAAAPAHSLEQERGFLFRNCAFTCAEGVKPGSIYLARPWLDHGLAVFENCSYGPHIAPAGFDKWNDTRRDETARFRETPPVPGRVDWANRR